LQVEKIFEQYKTTIKMKKVFSFTALALCSAVACAMPTDTTLVVNSKRIEITESENRMKIKVFETDGNDGETESEQIFEGHYRNGQSRESRKYLREVKVPVPTLNRGEQNGEEFNAHWSGFGMGFANFANRELTQINDVGGISLRSESSLEYNLNLIELATPLSKKANWAIVTGMGMRWSRYRIEGNHYLAETDGITSLHPAPPGADITASKLNITSLTVPLLLEWQLRHRKHAAFFISAGVVGVVKTISSSRITYKDVSNHTQKAKMDRGMNIRPISFDVLLQAGSDFIGVYAKYTPVELFEHGKGPGLHPVSIGMQLHF
jgi:hypothetical protein